MIETMAFIINNFCDFLNTCFWHYSVMLGAALLLFIFSGGIKKPVPCVLVILFLCSLTFHMMLRPTSLRYMLVPTLLSLPIIAFAAVALKRFLDDRFRGKYRWGLWLFCLLALVFVTLSFLKFNRRGRDRRDAVVIHAASLIREDFKKSSQREALLIGNSNDTGLVFLYAGIPGKFYNYSADSGNPQRFVSQTELLCSQYPLVYVLKEQRYRKQSNDLIFTRDVPSRHSYENVRIDRGEIDTTGKYGRVEVSRIESRIRETADRARIAGFLAEPPVVLRNGNFAGSQECRLSPSGQFGNRFLAKHPQQLLPAEWSVDFNNHRGADFRKWSFVSEPPDARAVHGVWRIHAPSGGFALQSRHMLPANRDCRLQVAAEFGSGCKLLVFLYVFRKDRTYLTTQPVGVYHCGKSGNRLLSFPILRSSLPAGGAFFLVGVIGWQGDLALKKVDIAIDDLKK